MADKRTLTKRAKYLLADAMSLATERLSSAPRRDKRTEDDFKPGDIASKAFVFIEEAARVLQHEYSEAEKAEIISAFEAALNYYGREVEPVEEVGGISA